MRGIVVGLGQVGYRVALLALQTGHEVTIVAQAVRPEWQREILQAGAKFVIGDGRDEHLLASAGLTEADWIISATAHDLTNIEIALDAKRLRPEIRTVARVFDQNLAPRLESTFGIDRVLTMSLLAAPAFVSAAFGDQLVASFDWLEDRYGVVRVSLSPGHRFIGMSVTEIEEEFELFSLLIVGENGIPILDPDPAHIMKVGQSLKLVGKEEATQKLGNFPVVRHYETATDEVRPRKRLSPRRFWREAPLHLRGLLLALISIILLSTLVFKIGLRLSPVDAFYFVVETVTTTGYGDITPRDSTSAIKLFACLVMLLGSATIATLYSIITDSLLKARIQEITIGNTVPDEGHVIVVGLGNVGFRVCEELMRLGVEPVGMDIDPDAKFAVTLKNQIAVIQGDAREIEILGQANFSTASAIISATSNDAVNLSVGLVAREEAGGQRVVLRMFDDRFARKVESTVAFNGVLSASGIAAPTFLGAANYPSALASFVVRGHFITLLERPANVDPATTPIGRTILGKSNRQITMVARPIVESSS